MGMQALGARAVGVGVPTYRAQVILLRVYGAQLGVLKLYLIFNAVLAEYSVTHRWSHIDGHTDSHAQLITMPRVGYRSQILGEIWRLIECLI